MDTPTIEKTIDNLNNRLSQYNPKLQEFSLSTNKLSFFTPYRQYIIIPIVVLIILFFSNLSIFYIEDNKGQKEFSYQRFFLFWLSISFVLILSLFGYNYKKSK